MKSSKFIAPAIALVGISMIVVGCTGPFASSSEKSDLEQTGSGQHVRGNFTGSGREMRPDNNRRGGKNGSGALSASGRMAPPTDGSWAMMPPPDASGSMVPPDNSGAPNPPDADASQKSADNIAPTGE